jgi:hypothetical protein
MKILIFNLSILIPIALSAKLSISGKHFAYNGQQVFLSGANFAWNQYSKLGKKYFLIQLTFNRKV